MDENSYYDFNDVSTRGLVVDKVCGISWDEMPWTSSFGAGSLSSGAVWFPASQSGGYQHLYLGRQIDLPVGHGSGIVNISPGTVKMSDGRWETGITQIKGQIRFGLQFRDNGNSATGTSYYIAPYKLKVEINVDGTSKVIESNGGILNIDLSFSAESEIRGMNLYAYFYDNRSIEIEPYNGALFLWAQLSSTVRSYKGDANAQYQDDVVSGINESNGLLSGILGGINDLWDAITSLPSKIADAIKSLFVPSQEDLTAIKAKYEQLLADRLGFVYQAGDMVTGFFTDFSSALQSEDEYEFVFPGIAFPMNGEIIVICEEMPVDLDNDVMAALRPVLGTIITIISVLGFLNVASDMLEAMISGKSYHDFLHRKDDDG